MATSIGNADSAAADSLAFPGSLTDGSLLVCVAIADDCNAPQGVDGVSDGTNGAWAGVNEFDPAGDNPTENYLAIFAVANSGTATPTVTVDWANGTGSRSLTIMELTASDTITFTTGEAPQAADGGTSTVDSGDVEVSEDENATICACNSGFEEPSAGTGFALVDGTISADWWHAAQYSLDDGAGTLNCEWGHEGASGDNGWSANAALFEVAAAGGGIPIPVAMHNYRKRRA